MEIRTMSEEDLAELGALADQAFIAVIAKLYGQAPPAPFFAPAWLGLRRQSNPQGSLVAVEGGRLAGGLLSLKRGSVAFFGPLAVATGSQGAGIGQALVLECIRRWRQEGVRLMGLETFPTSALHVHLYSKLGFQPGWTAVGLERKLETAAAGAGAVAADLPLQHPELPLPDLGYLYPGFDPTPEIRATLDRRAGRVLASDHGLAILQLDDALRTRPGRAYLPLLVAPDARTFDRLLDAAEEGARAAGKPALGLRVSGSSWSAIQRLLARGYQLGSTTLRMKAGERLDYDREAWYCDDWL